MEKLAVTKQCMIDFHGESFSLNPLTPPEINPEDILVCNSLLRSYYMKKKEAFPNLVQVFFDEKRLPAFPAALDNPPEKVPPGSKVLVIHYGAIGDLLMLSPALKIMRQRLGPDSSLWLSTPKERHILFEKSDVVQKLFPYPIRLSQLIQADYYVNFDGGNFASENMTEVFLKGFNTIAPKGQSLVPVISSGLTRSENMERTFSTIRANAKKRAPLVLFTPIASSQMRYLPPDIITTLLTHFPDVTFIIPKAGAAPFTKIEHFPAYYVDTFQAVEDFFTAVKLCDAVVSADTSTYHIAAGMGKPALVFFGSIDPELRALHYPLVRNLTATYKGQVCTAPCGLHSEMFIHPDHEAFKKLKVMGIDFHKGGCPEALCLGLFYSPCLSALKPDQIVAAFVDVIKMI
jgi:ADP-heptose:LPS heptosyltransferase